MEGDVNVKCNHRIKSKNNTITLLPGKRSFTYPEYVCGVCKCCGKAFRYIRDEHGELLSEKKEYKEGR